MKARAIRIVPGEKRVLRLISGDSEHLKLASNSASYKCSARVKTSPCICILILTYKNISKSRPWSGKMLNVFPFSSDKPLKRYWSVCTVEAGAQPQMLIHWAKKQSLLQVPCKRTHCLQQNFSEDWGHLSLHRGHSVSPGLTLGLHMHEPNISCYKHSSPSRPPSLSVLKGEFIENICTTRNILVFSKPHPPGGCVVMENRQSCITWACKQWTAVEEGCRKRSFALTPRHYP